MTRRHSLFAALVLAGALASGVAQAQAPQGGAQQPDLRAALHLRPDQMAAYNVYHTASRLTQDQIARLRANSPQALGAMPTPQRLDHIGAFLSLQMQLFQHTADATRAFYGQLSPAQQQVFDHITAPGNRGGPQG